MTNGKKQDVSLPELKNPHGEKTMKLQQNVPDLIPTIENFLTDKGMNASELAAAIGYSKSKISEVRSGKRGLSKGMAAGLFEVGIPATILFKALIL